VFEETETTEKKKRGETKRKEMKLLKRWYNDRGFNTSERTSRINRNTTPLERREKKNTESANFKKEKRKKKKKNAAINRKKRRVSKIGKKKKKIRKEKRKRRGRNRQV